MKKRRQGIALILTLMIATLLAMLAAAFIGVNQSNIRLITSQELQRKAFEAAQSGVDYARMRMERCTTWGEPTLHDPEVPGGPDVPEVIQVFESEAGVAPNVTYQVVGVLKGGESHFQLAFRSPTLNNITLNDLPASEGVFDDPSIAADPLGGPASWTPAPLLRENISINYINVSSWVQADLQPPANTTTRTLPKGGCRLMVMGYCRGVRRRIEVSFGQNALTTCAVASGQDTVMAMATNSSGKWTIDSAKSDSNEVRSNGNFYVSGHYTNPRVVFRDGTAPDAGSARASDNCYITNNLTVALESDGDVNVTTSVSNTSQAQRAAAGSAAKGEFLVGSSGTSIPPVTAADVEALGQTTYNKSILDGDYVFIGPNAVRHVQSGTTYTNSIPSSTGGGTAVYLNQGKFIIPTDHRVTVNGDFSVSNNVTGLVPTVAIGYNSLGTLPMASGSKGGVFTVKGDVEVDKGSVVGRGSLVASGGTGGDGNIRIAGKSDMSADPDMGVTLFSNDNVEIRPPVNATSIKEPDWQVFKAATETLAPPEWGPGGAKLNKWTNLNAAEKQAHTGSVSLSDANVTAPTNTTGQIRTTDVTTAVGNLSTSGSVVNALVNEYPFVVDAINSGNTTFGTHLQSMLDAFTTGNGTAGVGNVTVNATAGMTPGRYLRVREWLEANEKFLSNNPGATDPDPATDAWIDLADPTTNSLIGHKVVSQFDYYERQKGNCGGNVTNLRDLLGSASYPIVTPTADAVFRGMIVSKRNIFCQLGGGQFFVDGAMLCDDTLAVTNATSIYTYFNPAYVDALVKQLYGSKGTQLSITYWALH